MIIGGRRALFFLFAGDIVAFVAALYFTLWFRYLELPTVVTLSPYVVPFAILFILWTLVFYSAGLYSKRTLLFPSKLPDALLKTQLANIFFAALFFFFVPAFGIAPKTILALYLVISLALIFFWRFTVFARLMPPRKRESATLLAGGAEADELFNEVNGNPRYGIVFSSHSSGDLRPLVVADGAHLDTLLASNLIRDERHVVAFEDVYEEVFDRIPLSRLGGAWFRENVAARDPISYRITKRCIDILGGLLMGVITLAIAPLVFIGNRLEGSGPLFLRQERFGQHGKRIIAYKFRSMQKDLRASSEWVHEGKNRVTKVGAFLRQTSLDEFPQFINVLKGGLSLIGPRNDIIGLGERLMEALPYYKERYAVIPGITGWAQVNQRYEPGNVSPQSIEETKVRLAYDFYYLKHRSLGLDLIIALRTVKRMFFRLSSW